MKRTLVISVSLIALGLIAYALIHKNNETQSARQQTSNTVTVTWNLGTPLDTSEGVPMSTIGITISGGLQERIDLGTHAGCPKRVPTGKAQDFPTAKAFVLCWWAGSGDEFYIFQPNNTTIEIKHREIHGEQTETPQLETVKTITLPKNSIVQYK